MWDLILQIINQISWKTDYLKLEIKDIYRKLKITLKLIWKFKFLAKGSEGKSLLSLVIVQFFDWKMKILKKVVMILQCHLWISFTSWINFNNYHFYTKALLYTGWPRPFFAERNACISFSFEVIQKSLNIERFENYTWYLIRKMANFTERVKELRPSYANRDKPEFEILDKLTRSTWPVQLK